MKINGQPTCYGEMFPDLSALKHNQPANGHAFTISVESSGIGVQRREPCVKPDEWEKCEICARFRGCYHLSAAKLLLWQGLVAAA